MTAHCHLNDGRVATSVFADLASLSGSAHQARSAPAQGWIGGPGIPSGSTGVETGRRPCHAGLRNRYRPRPSPEGLAHGMTSLEVADRFRPDADIEAAWLAAITALTPPTITRTTRHDPPAESSLP